MGSSRTSKPEVVCFFRNFDPKLARIIEEINFDEWLGKVACEREKYFEDLCRTIVGQQLAGKAAEAIYSRFSNLLGNKVSPEVILKLDEQAIRNAGLSWAKVRSVRDLSERVTAGGLNLDSLDTLSDEELIAELSKVKGIGRWTAEMFLMFRLGHEDIFAMGDLGLKNGLKKFLGREDLSLDEVIQITNIWKPYRTYGAIAMWHLLDNR